MNKFKKHKIDRSRVTVLRMIKDMTAIGLTRKETKKVIKDTTPDELFINDTYTVSVFSDPKKIPGTMTGLVHLSIRRNDREPVHDWRDLQEIKKPYCRAKKGSYRTVSARVTRCRHGEPGSFICDARRPHNPYRMDSRLQRR